MAVTETYREVAPVDVADQVLKVLLATDDPSQLSIGPAVVVRPESTEGLVWAKEPSCSLDAVMSPHTARAVAGKIAASEAFRLVVLNPHALVRQFLKAADEADALANPQGPSDVEA